MGDYDTAIREHHAGDDGAENAEGVIQAVDNGEVLVLEALGVFASALVNGDESGLEPEDIPALREIEGRYGQPHDCIPLGFGECEITRMRGDIGLYIFNLPGKE